MFKFEKDEKVILEVRKHWFVMFVEALFLLGVALIPLVLAYSLSHFFFQDQSIDIGGKPVYLFSFLYFLWLLMFWIFFFIRWTDYYLDVWYITDKRVIAVDQKGLFRREVIDLKYEKVQDVTVEVHGIIPTLLNFGEIQIQTAGVHRAIVLKQSRNPNEAKKIILLQHSKVLERADLKDSTVVAD